MQKGKLLPSIFILALITLQLMASDAISERHVVSEDAPKVSVVPNLSELPQVACDTAKIIAQIERYRTSDRAELKKLGRGDADSYVQREYIACLDAILAAPSTSPKTREAAGIYKKYYQAMYKRMEAQRTIDSLPSDGKILANSALSDLKNLESFRPDLADVIHNERGIIYGILQDRKSAIIAFGKAREANNSWGLPPTNLANIYAAGGPTEVLQAMKHYDNAFNTGNPPPTAYLGLANLQLKFGDTTAACNNLDTAYKYLPDSPEVLYSKARMLAGPCGGSSSDTSAALKLVNILVGGKNGTKGKGYILQASLLQNAPGDAAINSLINARKYPGDKKSDRSAIVNLGRAYHKAKKDTIGANYLQRFVKTNKPDAGAYAAYLMVANEERWNGKFSKVKLPPDSLVAFSIEVVSELNSFKLLDKSIAFTEIVLKKLKKNMDAHQILIDLYVCKKEYTNACGAVCAAIDDLKGLPADYIQALNNRGYYEHLRADTCFTRLKLSAEKCKDKP